MNRRKSKSRNKKFPCNVEGCTKTLTSAAHLQRHLRSHTLREFICDYCAKTFEGRQAKDKLRLHILKHRKLFRVKCEVPTCQREYRTNQSMRKHLRTHFESHQCEECGKTFQHKRLLLNHVAALHKEEEKVACKYCTRMFPNTSTRDSHQKTIHPDAKVNTSYFKCNNCPLGFEMREELRIHSFIHFNGEIHTCLDCNQIFKKKKLLETHMLMHGKPAFECGGCSFRFKYRSNLAKHQRAGRCKGPLAAATAKTENSPQKDAETAKNQLLQMTVDPRRFNISNELDNMEWSMVKVEADDEFQEPQWYPYEEVTFESKPKRKGSKKNSGSTYICDLCEFSSDKKNKLLSHIRFHIASTRHKCKQCNSTFTTKINLHNHSMRLHGRGVIGSVEYSGGPAECLVCRRIFSQERLKYHMKLHEAPLFPCDKCGKRFRLESTLVRHVTSHASEKKFTCSTCGKSFKKMTVLKQHEETHNPYKIFVQCEICQSVMQMKSLKLHMEVKHGDRYKDKNFICQCGKAFRYEKQLEKHVEAVHEKAHRGKIYPCPECEQTFTRRLELREHSFDHFDLKVFVCDCGMKFKTRKLLKLHSVVHNDTKWPCDVCSQTFLTRGGRRKHKIKVHGHQNEANFIEIPSFEVD